MAMRRAECHTVDAFRPRSGFRDLYRDPQQPTGRPGFFKKSRIMLHSLGAQRFVHRWDDKFCRDLGSANPLARVLDYVLKHPDTCRLDELQS